MDYSPIHLLCTAALAAAFLTSAAAQEAPFTFRTPEALYSIGDFNADGVRDAVILDTASGTFRIGYQTSSTSYTWTPSLPSGVENASDLAVGRMLTLAPSRDALAVTAPDWNRVHLIGVPTPTSLVEPRFLFPAPASADAITAIAVDAAGTADLVQTSGPSYRAYTGLDATPVSNWTASFTNSRTPRLAAVRLKTGGPQWLAEYFQPNGSGDPVFYAELPGLSSPSTGGSIPGPTVPPASSFFHGAFGGSLLTTFGFYTANSTLLRLAAVTENSPAIFGISALTNINLLRAPRLIVPLLGSTPTRLAVLRQDGLGIDVYPFTGGTSLGAAVSIPPAEGTAGAGLLPLENGDFLFVSKDSASAATWRRYRPGASSIAEIAFGSLPPVRPGNATSNIVFLDAEPFVNPDATLKNLRRYREWSVAATPPATGTVQVSSQDFASTGTGLGTRSTTTLSLPSGAGFALVNQYLPALSIALLDGSPGAPTGDILFNPPPGQYPPVPDLPTQGGAALPGFTVTLTSSRTQDQIFYRTSPLASFTALRPDGIVRLPGTATIEAYAERPAGTALRSPTRKATYTLLADTSVLAPAAAVDADGDGLGDAWEAAFNVTSPGADADGDGASNLAEYLSGSDPRNSYSVPPPQGPLVLSSSQIAGAAGNVFRLEWPGTLTTVQLQASSDLQQWSTISSGITSSGGNFRYEVPLNPPAAPLKYFRLLQP